MVTQETSQNEIIQRASEKLAAKFGGTAEDWADDVAALGLDNVSGSLRMLHVDLPDSPSRWGRFLRKARIGWLDSRFTNQLEWLRARDLLPP